MRPLTTPPKRRRRRMATTTTTTTPPTTTRTMLILSLLLLSSSPTVTAQTKINLVGVNGETACALRDRVNSDPGCVGEGSSITPRGWKSDELVMRADSFEPVPSNCTCTTPFFNIWSTCGLLEARWSTLPTLKAWKTTCQNARILYRPEVLSGVLGGTQVPEWAKARAPGDDGVFDVVGVVLAVQTPRWTLLQTLAPVISALGLLLLLGLAYFLLTTRRRQSQHSRHPDANGHSSAVPIKSVGSSLSGPKGEAGGGIGFRLGVPGFLRPSPRVKNEDPRGDWVIDGQVGRGKVCPRMTPFDSATAGRHGTQGGGGSMAAGQDGAAAIMKKKDKDKRGSFAGGTKESFGEGGSKYETVTREGDEEEGYPKFHAQQLGQVQSKWSESDHQSTGVHPPPTQHMMLPPPTTANSAQDQQTWFTPVGKNSRGAGGGGVLGMLRGVVQNPFKARPVRVEITSVPRRGFRLDDYDRTTDSVVTGTRRKGSSSEESWSMVSGSSGGLSAKGPGYQYHEMAGDDERMERVTLISGEERSSNGVFLISKDGRNFSISDKTTTASGKSETGTLRSPGRETAVSSEEGGARSEEVSSQINVVSPTASTMSWRNSTLNHPPVPKLPPPPLPPPPRKPPPPSPPFNGKSSFPLANIADTPSPSQPLGLRERSGSEGSTASSSTAKTGRWEPITVDQTGAPARPNLLHPPLRTVYEVDRYPEDLGQHQRTGSLETPRIVFDDTFSFEPQRPAPTPPPVQVRAVYSPPAPQAPAPPVLQHHHYQQRHQRAHSNSNASVRALPTPPPLAPTPTPSQGRRGLHEDDASSFYLTAAESSTTHLRKASVESLVKTRRSDPINLFPASVRSAGYGVQPT